MPSLAIEMFKVSNNIAPTIIDKLFTKSHYSYNLRAKSNFVVTSTSTLVILGKILHALYLEYDIRLHIT